MKTKKSLRLVLGNQLFPFRDQQFNQDETIFMCEDFGLCSYVKHHKSKIALFFSAMRSFRDEALRKDLKVIYFEYSQDFNKHYPEKLLDTINSGEFEEVVFFEIEDKAFEKEIFKLIDREKISFIVKPSPMFLDNRESFAEFSGEKKFILQANHYKRMRKKLDILIDNKKPQGGKWSYDDENRKKLPKNYDIPMLPVIKPRSDFNEISRFIETTFDKHPGKIDIIFPFTHDQAIKWLNIFFQERFHDFGPYEDAINKKEHFQLHSVLSTSLNLGLLTPKLVIEKALDYASNNKIPLNSLEGFVRQIIGWREFIRGIYQNYSEKMIGSNYWNHTGKLTDHWYEANTGVDPLDDAILGAHEYGYTHHINRLMVISSIMNMARIHPDEIYKWFMEMFVDSSEWVMVPNIYGMGTFADGGIFATKPYICGSSYILRMSNFKKGPWCEIVDGLYWKFISDNKDFFSKNPRLSLMIRALDKLEKTRKQRIFEAAESFIRKISK